jgi:hypothetical protein
MVLHGCTVGMVVVGSPGCSCSKARQSAVAAAAAGGSQRHSTDSIIFCSVHIAPGMDEPCSTSDCTVLDVLLLSCKHT